MSPLSRRGFLLAAASAGALVPAAAAAAASPAPSPAGTAGGYVPPPQASAGPMGCEPTGTSPGVMHATGALGPVTATVSVRALKDVVALRYQLTNSGDTQNTYVVTYVDQVTTFSSRPTSVTVAAGGTHDGVLYGSLGHEFLFYVDLPDGTTLTLGPLNRAASCGSRRRRRKPLYQPSTHHHGSGG
jgi:hypothetical protein